MGYGFVEKSAMGASNRRDRSQARGRHLLHRGRHPVLQHGMVARHRRMLQAHVAAREPPEKAATQSFQVAGAQDGAAF